MKLGAKNLSDTRKILNNNNVHTHARTHARTHAHTHADRETDRWAGRSAKKGGGGGGGGLTSASLMWARPEYGSFPFNNVAMSGTDGLSSISARVELPLFAVFS